MVAVHYGRACCVLCLFICMSAACRPRAKWGDGGQPTMELMRSPLGAYCSQNQDAVADPVTVFLVVIIGAEFLCLLLAYLPMSFFYNQLRFPLSFSPKSLSGCEDDDARTTTHRVLVIRFQRLEAPTVLVWPVTVIPLDILICLKGVHLFRTTTQAGELAERRDLFISIAMEFWGSAIIDVIVNT